MEAKCVACHDRPAVIRCIQCHKPVCDECSFKDENGAFCSRRCAANYRSWRQAQASAASRKSGGLLKVIIVLLILAAVALAAWKLGLLPSSVTDRLPDAPGTGQQDVRGPEEGAEQAAPGGPAE